MGGNVDGALERRGGTSGRDVAGVDTALGNSAGPGLGRGCRCGGLGYGFGFGLGLFFGGLGEVDFQIIERAQVVLVGHADGLHHGQVGRLGCAVGRAGEEKLGALQQQAGVEQGVEAEHELGGDGEVVALDAGFVGAAQAQGGLPFGLGHPGLAAYVGAEVHGAVLHGVVPFLCVWVGAVVAFH